MARDMKKKMISDGRYAKKAYEIIGVQIRKSSDLFKAFEKCISKNNVQIAPYIRDAIEESLKEDGEM